MNNNRAANEISAATKRRKAKRIKTVPIGVTAKKASKFITLAQQAGERLKGAVVFGEIL